MQSIMGELIAEELARKLPGSPPKRVMGIPAKDVEERREPKRRHERTRADDDSISLGDTTLSCDTIIKE